jgi:hypothetical protein
VGIGVANEFLCKIDTLIQIANSKTIMRTELLIVLPDNETFCNSKRAFVDFLKVDSLITIVGQKISYKKLPKGKDIVSAKFSVETDKVKSNQERYFQLNIECVEEKLVDEFNELCERIKMVCGRISPGATSINTLWDDVGRIYAEKSYPLINEVENLMRRLIAKFMLVNVGMNWSKDTIQPELLKKIEKFDEEEPFIHDLYKLDFIHLKQVLFEKKRDISLDELDRVLAKTSFSEVDKEKIRKYSPRSNWEKYFAALVDEKDASLETKWERLYKLRNKVAHNRHVKKKEFVEINGISMAIKAIILKAAAKLGEIDINEEDRDLIIYSYNSNSPSAVEYISEKSVAEYYMGAGYTVTSVDYRLSHVYEKFDFIAEKEGQKIGVDIFSIRPRNFISHMIMLDKRRNYFEYHNSKDDVSMKVHMVYVLRQDEDDYSIDRLLTRAERYSEKLGDRYELYFGTLGEGNVYLPISAFNRPMGEGLLEL